MHSATNSQHSPSIIAFGIDVSVTALIYNIFLINNKLRFTEDSSNILRILVILLKREWFK